MTIDWRGPMPRMPRRARTVECFEDCQAQVTGNPADCACGDRDDAAYEAEGDRRYDAWKNGDYAERRDRDDD